MANNILKKPSVRPNKGKNGFDMSRRRQFTAPCGMLLPVFKDFANPGDKYKLNSSAFIRTEALQTAAFMRLKSHVDWFFVPITQLFSRWNEFYNGTNDVMSTAYINHSGGIGHSSYDLPVFFLNAYLQQYELANEGKGAFGKLLNPTAGNTTGDFLLSVDKFGIPLVWNFRRLWDMLGYGSVDSYNRSGEITFGSFSFTLLDFLAYHKIYHSHYRLTDWEANDPTLYNVDYLSTGVSYADYSYVENILSTIHYRPYRKDYFTNIMPQPLFCGSFASYIPNQFNSSVANLRSYINPELAASTQNGVTTQSLDLIFGSKPSDIDGDSDTGNSAFSVASSISTDSSLAASDIRAVFALDKLLRVTAFAGGHYADQILAHFGYEIPKGISDEAYYLGSQTTDININEVVATASTGIDSAGGTIGDIAGKGFGSTAGSRDIDFTAPCHGFIMAIFSIEPEPDYASKGCEVLNRYRESLDFYHPELDDLGMQPMFGVFNNVYGPSNSDRLNGWTYRYSELKSTFDVVNEGFWNTHKQDWVGFKQSVYGRSDGDSARFDLQFYVAPQYTNTIFLQSVPYFVPREDDLPYGNPSEGNFSSTNPLYSFKTSGSLGVSGRVLSFYNNDLTSADTVYSSDNFLITANFKCFKSSIMSVHSLPKMM